MKTREDKNMKKKLTLKELMNANPDNQVEETSASYSNKGTTVTLVRRISRLCKYPYPGKQKGYQQIRIVFV